MASVIKLAASCVGQQLIGVSNYSIKKEVKESLLSAVIDLKGGIIGSYLVSGINAFYKAIVYINKLQYR